MNDKRKDESLNETIRKLSDRLGRDDLSALFDDLERILSQMEDYRGSINQLNDKIAEINRELLRDRR